MRQHKYICQFSGFYSCCGLFSIPEGVVRDLE